jgi:hypothetical protein
VVLHGPNEDDKSVIGDARKWVVIHRISVYTWILTHTVEAGFLRIIWYIPLVVIGLGIFRVVDLTIRITTLGTFLRTIEHKVLGAEATQLGWETNKTYGNKGGWINKFSVFLAAIGWTAAVVCALYMVYSSRSIKAPKEMTNGTKAVQQIVQPAVTNVPTTHP